MCRVLAIAYRPSHARARSNRTHAQHGLIRFYACAHTNTRPIGFGGDAMFVCAGAWRWQPPAQSHVGCVLGGWKKGVMCDGTQSPGVGRVMRPHCVCVCVCVQLGRAQLERMRSCARARVRSVWARAQKARVCCFSEKNCARARKFRSCAWRIRMYTLLSLGRSVCANVYRCSCTRTMYVCV